MASVPKDPMMLLSFVNTQLRDHYPDIEEFCGAYGISRDEIDRTLSAAGFEYDREGNRYV